MDNIIPTPGMEITPINGALVSSATEPFPPSIIEEVDYEVVDPDQPHPNFIESNTQAISLYDLSTKCIIPTFADGTLTISHQNFINATTQAAERVFGELTPVECRVSHPITGRTPEAQYKKQSELLDSDKTLFYQRIAWVCHVKNINRTINGHTTYLCIAGVRSYHEDKLYNRLSPSKFHIVVSWQLKICSNLMVQCSGSIGTMDCMTEADIYQKALELFSSFDPEKENNLRLLENLSTTPIPEELFCKIIGRMRLYQFLPPTEQKKIPLLNIGDQAVNAMIKGYVSNPNFGKKEGEDITTWNLLQLMNESVKQAYIDKWLERNQNCTDFAIGIQRAINGEDTEYSWYLS